MNNDRHQQRGKKPCINTDDTDRATSIVVVVCFRKRTDTYCIQIHNIHLKYTFVGYH
jgi:hypothetical protein